MWDQAALEKLITDQIQESLTLEYKAAAALDRTDGKTREITKDISAIANSAGGVIIYGMSEYDQKDKQHLPSKLDPIDQSRFSREWLEQIINNIRPRISGVIIHPVQHNGDITQVVFVVDIPQSSTAHQAMDKRYYKRFNFQCVPMEDHEIRDVMGRRTTPEVNIAFSLYSGILCHDDPKEDTYDTYTRYYGVRILLKNRSVIVVNRYKVELVFENAGWCDDEDDLSFHERLISLSLEKDPDLKLIRTGLGGQVEMKFIYQPSVVLFPNEEIDIGHVIRRGYTYDSTVFSDTTWRDYAKKMRWAIKWKVYADNMPSKVGEVKVWELERSDGDGDGDGD